MICLSGYSDDVVSIEGDVRDEIGAFDQDICFTIGNPEASAGIDAAGCVVTMAYGRGPNPVGVWSATVSQFDEDVPIPWPIRFEAKGYSVHVIIDCPPGTPVKWTKVKAAL